MSDLASELGVGTTYLAKILQNLIRAGLLRGVRGPGGGVVLARAPQEIRQWDVMAAVQCTEPLDRCVLGWDPCDPDLPCPLHEEWSPIRARILEMLRNHTVWDLALETGKQGESQGPSDVLGDAV